ncbi:hypothetical protein J6590_093829, partial [Homalodisca vitripennis]
VRVHGDFIQIDRPEIFPEARLSLFNEGQATTGEEMGGLVLSGSASTRPVTHSPPPLLVTALAVAVSATTLPTHTATHGDLSFTPRRASGHHLVKYAEVVRVTSTPGSPGQPAPPQSQLNYAKINSSLTACFRKSTCQQQAKFTGTPKS